LTGLVELTPQTLFPRSVAYIHTTLTFRRSPLAEALPREGKLSGLALEDARAMLDHLLSLVPFAEEPKSTVLLTSVKEARLYTSSHLEASVSIFSHVMLSVACR
jgi:hypothetical protein